MFDKIHSYIWLTWFIHTHWLCVTSSSYLWWNVFLICLPHIFDMMHPGEKVCGSETALSKHMSNCPFCTHICVSLEWIMPNVWMSMSESYQTCVWMNHVKHMRRTCHTQSMSMNESCQSYVWMNLVKDMTESCHTQTRLCDMSYTNAFVWHVSYVTQSYTWHTCVYVYMWHVMTYDTCHMTADCVTYDTCVTCHDMSHMSYDLCDMSHSHTHGIHDTDSLCHVSVSYVIHMSYICHSHMTQSHTLCVLSYANAYRPGEVGGWGRDPKKCTGRDWGMGSSTI